MPDFTGAASHREEEELQMTEQAAVTDAMLENAVRHHSDKIKYPRTVQALVDEYLVTTSTDGDVRHIPKDRRTEFLIQLAKLE
jgi:hypothetical protein